MRPARSLWRVLLGALIVTGAGIAVAAAAWAGYDGPTPPQQGDPTSAYSAPPGPSAIVSNTGGALTGSGGSGTKYYYVVTATYAAGQSAASAETSATVPTGITTASVQLIWSGTSGATSYNVYRSTTSGTYTSPALIASGLGSTTFTDTGAAPTTGAPATTSPAKTPNTAPHGGYGSTTAFCQQCHSVHGAASEYVLLRQASVTDTCETCHGVGGVAATGAGSRLGGGTGTLGTTSSRSVYKLTGGAATSQHELGATSIPDETLTITEVPGGKSAPSSDSTLAAGPGTFSAGAGGLYCASCHTPHGDYGNAVNTKKVWTTDGSGSISTMSQVNWAEGNQVWWKNVTTGAWQRKWLHLDTDPVSWEYCNTTGTAPTFTNVATSPVAAGPDSGCAYAQMRDAQGALVSAYAYKLLSSSPNHTYSRVVSWGTDKYDHDQPGWCGACHNSKVDTQFTNFAGHTGNNHPTGCTACHGNPSNDPSSTDFPHTSSMGSFLKDYPDAICVTCHTGNLP